MQAVVLAGGSGHASERTRALPKALLPIAGRPFLAWQMAAIAGAGFTHVLVCIAHLGDQIRDFSGDGAAFGVTVAYAEDGPHLMGTGGALRRALPVLAPTFLVTYGDSYLPFDYAAPLRDLQMHPEALGTMSVFQNEGAWDASNSEVRGEAVVRYQKGGTDAELRYIDYGALALRRSVFESRSPDRGFSLSEVQAELASAGQLRAFLARERFYEIGSERGIADLEAMLAAR